MELILRAYRFRKKECNKSTNLFVSVSGSVIILFLKYSLRVSSKQNSYLINFNNTQITACILPRQDKHLHVENYITRMDISGINSSNCGY